MALKSREGLATFAVSRSLFAAKSLEAAIDRLGYVQADPIRAPARAQDLILRHRVAGYRVDDLEREYPRLSVFEDMLHNYGFFPQRMLSVMYPRQINPRWQQFLAEHAALSRKVMRFVDRQGEAHPRDVDVALAAGRRANGWGGHSSATRLVLEGLHHRGKLRVVRRDAGIRVYARATSDPNKLTPAQRADGLLELQVNLYAPLPTRTLMQLVSMMGARKPGLDYARRLAKLLASGKVQEAVIDGTSWLWPAGEPTGEEAPERVCLLTPFDPIVWDRRRFEYLWGWAYRFEAYTPPAKRQLGYYALPLLWRDRVIGWANVTRPAKKARIELGFVGSRPRDPPFKRALEEEWTRLQQFLTVPTLQERKSV